MYAQKIGFETRFTGRRYHAILLYMYMFCEECDFIPYWIPNEK